MPSCGGCGKGFASGGCAGIHVDRWQGGCKDTFVYNCPDCMDVFNTSNRRKTHMNKEHTGATCPICKKRFYRKTRLDQHRKDTQHDKTNCNRQHFDKNVAARQFHDLKARQETWKIDDAFKSYYDITKKITDTLKKNDMIDKCEYVGSAYERTSVKNSSDFDVMLVKHDKSLVVSDLARAPGYAKLRNKDGAISASQMKNDLKGAIQKVLNTADFGKRTVKLRDHGAALDIDIYSGKRAKRKLCSIDLVPTMEAAGGKMFVYKPPKQSHRSTEDNDRFLRAYSLEAKEKLLGADRNNGCRREVYRTCKVIRNRESTLEHISSYELKTALFKTMDQKPGSDWSRDQIGDRTLEVLRHVENAYRSGGLSNYYMYTRYRSHSI